MPEPRFHQREGDAGIDGLSPAESEPLHQHPGDLGHIRVGIGIRGATPNHHQQGLGSGHVLGGLVQTLLHPGPGGRHHQAINPQFAAVVDRQTRFSCVGVENGGDVVLGVPGREQHRWNGQNPGHTLLTQGLEPIPQDRPGKFQIAMLNRHRGQLWSQGFDHLGEFIHRQPVATAMAADQNAESFGWKVGQRDVPLFI